jgi:hypothetical protein
MSGTTWRAKAQAQQHHWRDNIFCFEGSLLKWFNDRSFSRNEDFINMTDEEVEDIEYKDDDGGTITVPRHHRSLTEDYELPFIYVSTIRWMWM